MIGNLLLYVLLIFAGINVPLDRLPGWMSTLAQGLPVTHGANAARQLVAGAPLSHVLPLIAASVSKFTDFFGGFARLLLDEVGTLPRRRREILPGLATRLGRIKNAHRGADAQTNKKPTKPTSSVSSHMLSSPLRSSLF